MNNSKKDNYVPESPFPGIDPYGYGFRNLFFARKVETQALIQRVMLYRGVLLYSDSGNGKSSLINSGLIPAAIDEGYQPEVIRVQPKNGAEIIIQRISTTVSGGPPFLSSLFAQDEKSKMIVLSVKHFLEILREKSKTVNSLLIFDQFEEWVTLFEEGSTNQTVEQVRSAKQNIQDAIVSIINDDSLPVKIMISLREDYLAKLAPIFKQCPRLSDHHLRLTLPKADQIYGVIRGPFEKFSGVFVTEIEPSLARKIEAQFEERMRGADIRLAEVQIVCERLVDSGKKGSELEHLFAEEGGVQGILEKYLEQTLNSLPADQREPAIALLSRMITSAGTRNVISRDDLLMRVSLEEYIPEALLNTTLDSLEKGTKLVRRERRRDVYYYEIASEFLVSWIIEKSQERKSKIEEKKLLEVQQKAEAERRRADDLARKTSQLRKERRMLIVAIVFAVILLGSTVYFLRTALKQEKLSFIHELTWAASKNLTVDPELSLLLSMHAASELRTAKMAPRPDVESTFRDSLQAARLRMTLSGHYNSIWHVTFSKKGDKLATAEGNGKIKVWDSRTGVKSLDLTGHEKVVHSVSFNADGTLLSSGSADKTVRLWDATTGKELMILRGHNAEVLCTAFSPDGSRIVSGSRDKTLRLWDVKTGQSIGAPLEGHKYEVMSVAFSPDGKRIASGGNDNTVIIWNAETGKELRRLSGHNGHKDLVSAVAFSPDGKRVASASFDRTVRVWTVRVWDEESGSLLSTFLEHTGKVYTLAFSPDGKYVASGSLDKTMRIWDSVTGKEYMPYKNTGSAVLTVDFNPNGKQLVTGSLDGKIQLWDISNPAPLITMHGDPAQIWAAAYSPDGEVIATAGQDGTAKIWDAKTGKELLALSGNIAAILSIAISNVSGNLRIATASADGTAKIWDGVTGEEKKTLSGHAEAVWAVAFSHDGKRIATGSADGTAIVWNTANGQQEFRLHGHTKLIFNIRFSPDNKYIATSCFDQTVKIWAADSGRLLHTLRGHKSEVLGIAFSPNGKLMATAGWDGTVKIWDAINWYEKETISGHSEAVIGVAFSPDGKFLATSSWDKTVKVWDVGGRTEVAAVRTEGKKKEIPTLYGHTGAVMTVAFSPRGDYLVTASFDGTSKIWELNPRTSLYTANVHREKINSVAFSPDNSRFVTASDDGTAKIMDVDRGKELVLLGSPNDYEARAVLSPDGKHLASSDPNGIVKIWDITSGKLLHGLPAHKSSATDIAFSPDGTFIVTVSSDRNQNGKVWDTKSGKLLFEMREHTAGINAVAFSPDGKKIATASSDYTVKIWDALNGKILRTIAGHTNEVFDVVFSPDGQLLATGSRDMTARVWDASSGKVKFILPDHGWWVDTVKFSLDGRRIATSSQLFSATLRLWDVSTGKLLNKFENLQPSNRGFLSSKKSPYSFFDLSPTGDRILTADRDNTIKIWDVEKKPRARALRGHTGRINSLVFSFDGKFIASASDDKTVKLWDAVTGAEILTFQDHKSPVYGISLARDNEHILTVAKEKKAKIWSLKTGKEEATITILPGHEAAVKTVAFSVDGKQVITASPDKTARIWDAKTGQELLVMPFDGHLSGEVSALAISSDNDHIAIAGQDGTVRFWDEKKRIMIEASAHHTGEITSIAFSPDGKWVVSGSKDKTAIVWKTSSGQEVCTLYGHTDEVKDVAISPKGKRIATVSKDQIAKVWDAKTGKALFMLSGLKREDEAINVPIVFSSDGRRIATSGKHGEIYIWDAENGHFIWTMQGDKEISRLAFDPGGNWLASASKKGQIRLYAFSTEGWLKLARERITRSLTVDECRSYFRHKCPPNVEALRMLVQGRSQAKSGAYEDAVRSFKHVRSLDPTIQFSPEEEAGKLVAETLVAEGMDSRRRKDLKGAADKFVQALKRDYSIEFGTLTDENKDASHKYIDDGRKFVYKGVSAQAIVEFIKALALDPRNVYAHYGIGLAYRDNKEFGKAIDHFDIALHIAGDNPYLYADLAQAYSLNKRYDKAMESVNKSLKEDPQFGYGLIASGRIKRDMGDNNAALQEFNRVKEDDPYYVMAASEAGFTYYVKMFQYQLAYQQFKKAYDLDPSNIVIVVNFAEANLATGRFKEAYDLARQVLNQSGVQPLETESHLNMRFILTASALLDNRPDVARQELKNFVNLYNSVEKGYKPTGDYSGAEHFISNQTMDNKHRQLLIALIDIIKNKKGREIDLKFEDFDRYL